MTTLALPGGRGSVRPDLPPTLLPHAIAAAAPPRERLRSLLIAGAVYALLGGAGALLAHTRAVRLVPPGRLEPPIILTEFDPPPPAIHPEITPPLPDPAPMGASSRAAAADPLPLPQTDPDAIPTGLPTEDHHADRPPAARFLQGIGTSQAVEEVSGAAQVRTIDLSSVRILHQVSPVYPALARLTHIQGPVVLMMTIDTAGVPTDVQMLQGHPVFREEAIRAARQWRFEPARMEGRAVPASFQLTLNFRLQ